MAITPDQFLRDKGFNANPFATTNAEQETEFLPAFFLRVAWFEQLVGNPRRPESLLLFAPQGHGKTSHRIELGRRAGDHETPALVVTLNDFSALLRNGIEHVSINTYVAVLRNLFLKMLDAQLQSSETRLQQLQTNQRLWLLFCALLDRHAPHLAFGYADRPPGLHSHIKALASVEFSAKDMLKELSALACGAGFASVYVLLDGVDELYETKGNAQAIFRLISPLLDAPGLLQECGFAFKFFLPQDLEAEMRHNNIGRLDRIPSFSLSWSNDQIRKMFSQRLISYSLLSPTNPDSALVRQFKDLCATADFDVDAQLADAAHTSPRRMIDLAREIVVRHCDTNPNVRALISTDIITQVLQTTKTHIPRTRAEMALEPQPAAEIAPPEPLLFVDERGDVWLGDKRLSNEMPSLMRKCLDYLWSNRNRHISYAELQDALYGYSPVERGDPKSSCTKLVKRLREHLEPGTSASRRYIDVQPGFGYVLRNFRDQ